MVLGDDGAHLLAAGTRKPFAPVTGGVALGGGHLGFLFAVLQFLSSFYNLSVIILAQWTKPEKHYNTFTSLQLASLPDFIHSVYKKIITNFCNTQESTHVN